MTLTLSLLVSLPSPASSNDLLRGQQLATGSRMPKLEAPLSMTWKLKATTKKKKKKQHQPCSSSASVQRVPSLAFFACHLVGKRQMLLPLSLVWAGKVFLKTSAPRPPGLALIEVPAELQTDALLLPTLQVAEKVPVKSREEES